MMNGVQEEEQKLQNAMIGRKNIEKNQEFKEGTEKESAQKDASESSQQEVKIKGKAFKKQKKSQCE